jgi:synaptic vesicle membrane protein VAT-1
MRALVMTKRGGPDDALAVQEWPDPDVASGQVRIRVQAAGLNFADVLARVGLYPDAPKPPTVMGYEVAGEIDSVGPASDGFQPGDRVMAGTRFNGFAELATTDIGNVMRIPEGMSFEQAAALPVNYGTAYAAIARLAAVRPGETVLVHAAAGGVGIAALQILRDRGAIVIGTASAPKHDAVRAEGAEHVIDYRTQDVKREVSKITDGRGVDVVLDALGTFRESYAMLRPGGRMVIYGASQLLTGDRRNMAKALRAVVRMPRFNALKLMNENRSVMGLNLLKLWDDRGSLDEIMEPLGELIERGVVKPVVAETFPFDRAGDAHRYIQERRNIGKVVLTP